MTVNLNGDMSQWTMGAAALPDMFRLHHAGAAVHTIARSTDVPDLGLARRKIPYSLEITVATADASVGATDLTVLTYRGEGCEMQALGRAPIRQRLFLKGLPGVYNLHFSNGAETISRAQPLVLQHADMWTGFDVGTPEVPDFDGSWWSDSRVGYTIGLTLACGANFQAEMERWQSGLKFGTGGSNFNATVGNKLKIAGLRVGDGPLFYEAPEITERDCLRYLQTSFNRGQAPGQNLGWQNGESIAFAQAAGAVPQWSDRVALSPMRIEPAMTGYNPGAGNAQARSFSHGDCTGTTFDAVRTNGFRWYATSPAGTTVGEHIGLGWVADARLPALTQNVGS